MEIRAFAERVLRSDSLDEKLAPPGLPLTDDAPGEPWRPAEPVRPDNLQFAPRRTAPEMPSAAALADPRKRAVAHHIMANHELQALEVMAFMLTAFSDAPTEFRFGMVEVMRDEQRHTRMHQERAAALGIEFGSLPVNCYIWKKAQDYQSVLDYLAGLPLTFENRNLDHTLEFEAAFLAAGDRRSAALVRRIHEDEIAHVAFGIEWLRRLKPPGQTDWDAYVEHLHWPLRPQKAIGNLFQRDARRRAGLDAEFVSRLEANAPRVADDSDTA
jgi:uncharacterized ferritin-like protein (DUF455 family)